MDVQDLIDPLEKLKCEQMVGTKIGNISILSKPLELSKILYLNCKCELHNFEFDIYYESLLEGGSGCPKCSYKTHYKENEKTNITKMPLYRIWYNAVKRHQNNLDQRYNPKISGSKTAFLNFINDLKELNIVVPEKNTYIGLYNVKKGLFKDNIKIVTKTELNQKKILNCKQILEIREKYKTQQYKCKDLSKEYNISIGTISDIITRKTWKNI